MYAQVTIINHLLYSMCPCRKEKPNQNTLQYNRLKVHTDVIIRNMKLNCNLPAKTVNKMAHVYVCH